MKSVMGYFDPSDSRAVSTKLLEATSADDCFAKIYWHPTANYSQNVYPQVIKVLNPRGGYISAGYNDQKVRSLTAPLGADGAPYQLYAFDYKKDKTIVTNALGVKSEYCFSHRRLSEVKESGRVRGYIWSEKTGQLKNKKLQDPQRNVLEAILFHYDNKGNIAQKWECGNITGDSPENFSSGYNFKPGQDHVRVHSYTYGPFCNILKKEAPNGTITTYGYKEGTNLVTSKLVSFKGVIQEREFYDYDKNGILIQKVEDDGIGQDRNNLSNVTYWLVTRFQPQMDRNLWGLTKPAIEEKYYFDFSVGQEILIERIEFEYARGGQLAKKRVYDNTGALAYQESFRYNERLQLEEVCDRLGRITHYGYDACFNVIYEELVGSGKKTYKNYDLCNRLIESKEIHDDGTVLITSTTYDLMGNCTSVTDPEGFTTQYVYDELSRKVKEIDPYGNIKTMVYDLRDNPTAVTDKEGHTTRTKYNIDHHPIQIDYPDGSKEIFRYYVDGNLKSKKEKDGSSISYTYDYKGRVLSENRMDQAGKVLTQKSYLYKGANLIDEIDPQGYVTHYTYDNGKRLISKTREGVTETYGYDSLGRLCTTTKANKVTQKVFDVSDRIIEERVEDLFGNVYRKTAFAYDIYGNVKTQQTYTNDNDKIETTTLYNSCNLPILKIDGMGNQTTISYNHLPFQKITTDPLGQTTIETYDAHNRMVSKEIPGLMKQEVLYSPEGHRIKQIDHIYQQGVETGLSTVNWTYDSMGNVISIIEQDLKETSHTYLYGRLDTTKKPDGVILYHTYDALGRLKEQSSSDGTICTQYSYDFNGNMLSAEDKVNDLSVMRTYDAHNNITSETTHTTLYYSYDDLNRLTEICFPDSTISYTYNPVDLLEINRQNKTHSYEYDLAGRFIQEKTFDGTTTFYSYNDNHHLTSITSPFYQQTFVYDAADNITATTINNETTTYTYDGLYQLIGENTTSYTYDSLYNRLSKDDNPYENNSLHQVLSDNDNIYTYDPNGNRLTKNGITYTYDALNRLKSAGEIRYTYDPLGRLQTRLSPTSQESYLYYKEKDLGTLNNLRILGKGIAALEQNGQLYSVIRDHRGSPSVVLCDAYPVATYTYTAFGETSHSGSIDSPWQYSGHRCDAGTHLLHAPKRIYDPYIGRWLTPDPLGFADGPNLYAYVHNNPMIFIDSTGLYTHLHNESFHSYRMGHDLHSHQRHYGGFNRGLADTVTFGASRYLLGSYRGDQAAYNAGVVGGLAILGAPRAAHSAFQAAKDFGSYALREMGAYAYNYFKGKPSETPGKVNAEQHSINFDSKIVPLPKEKSLVVYKPPSATNRFPKNPDELLPWLPRDVKGFIQTSDNLRIRIDKGHARKPGFSYNPRHEDLHYHVESRRIPTEGWKDNQNIEIVKPPGYVPESGYGTGFLPGENFPGI